MKCPICQKEVNLDDPFMPFCSDRCRILDLGQLGFGEIRDLDAH